MKSYSQSDLLEGLSRTGLNAGDTVLVGTRLFSLGRMREATSRQNFLDRVFACFMEVIGDEGTLVVHTYTTQTARFGKPFVWEKTPCINGMFPQYVLERSDSIRSIHPVNSFTATGANRHSICSQNSRSNYGYGSPPHRLHEAGTRLTILGLGYGSSSLMHYAETLCAVPYCYNKLLKVPVYKNGTQLGEEFTANVRYLDLEFEYDYRAVQKRLDDSGAVSSYPIGAGFIHGLSADDFCCTAFNMLCEDPFAFLRRRPDFVEGQLPYDGITVGRDGVEQGAGLSGFDFSHESDTH